MKGLLASLLLCGSAVAAAGPSLKLVSLHDVSLRDVALEQGERIASIEVEVAGASFSEVRIPIDWSFEIGAPVSGVALLRGEAAHGVGMPFTTDAFQRFIRVARYDYGHEQPPFAITVKLGLYLYDPKTKSDIERKIQLPSESIALTEPAKSLEPTATGVTPPAGAGDRAAGSHGSP